MDKKFDEILGDLKGEKKKMENRLLLKHLLETLRMEHEIELRNEDDCRLFNCPSFSQALEPYYNREVIVWFAIDNCKVVILIGEQEC